MRELVVDEQYGLKLLDVASTHINMHNGKLAVNVGDQAYSDIEIFRAFPLSDSSHYWGLIDSTGADIGVIARPEELDENSRAVAQAALHRRYFVPIVSRVVEVTEDFGSIFWTVESDRGDHKYHVRGMKDNMVELTTNRIMITDVDGNRFEIPDVSKLDRKSMEIVMRSL